MPLPNPLIISTAKDYTGPYKIVFSWNEKKYTAERNPDLEGTIGALEKFERYLKSCEKKGSNPFKFSDGDKILINGKPLIRKRNQPDIPPKKPLDPEQLSFLASSLDSIASSLEKKGQIKIAEEIDTISNVIDQYNKYFFPVPLGGWNDIEGMQFWDEISNLDIKNDDAKKILDAFDAGADTEHSCSDITKIDAWTCKAVLDIAEKFGLINIINNGQYLNWMKRFYPEEVKKDIQKRFRKLQKEAADKSEALDVLKKVIQTIGVPTQTEFDSLKNKYHNEKTSGVTKNVGIALLMALSAYLGKEIGELKYKDLIETVSEAGLEVPYHIKVYIKERKMDDAFPFEVVFDASLNGKNIISGKVIKQYESLENAKNNLKGHTVDMMKKYPNYKVEGIYNL